MKALLTTLVFFGMANLCIASQEQSNDTSKDVTFLAKIEKTRVETRKYVNEQIRKELAEKEENNNYNNEQ